jgi:uncharacterized protein (TIGR03437 family)
VFDYRGGPFMELARPWRHAAMPLVVIEDGRPQIFHGDGKLVTRDDSVRPGEDVSAKAMDLGATTPAIPTGEPFPRDQRAEVIANVEARVNGAPAEILLKTGWPTTTLYRVEIRIPATTPKGLSWLQLTAGGVTGPAVEFPVR